MANDLTPTKDAPVSLPRWINGWVPAHGVPVSRGDVVASLRAVEAAMRPADYEEIAVRLDQCMAHFRTPENWRQVAVDYLDALLDMPADLMRKAVDHVTRTHRYPDAPKVGDFTAAVEEEWRRRRGALYSLRVAALKADGAPPPRPDTAERKRCLQSLHEAATELLEANPEPERPVVVPIHVDLTDEEREERLRRVEAGALS